MQSDYDNRINFNSYQSTTEEQTSGPLAARQAAGSLTSISGYQAAKRYASVGHAPDSGVVKYESISSYYGATDKLSYRTADLSKSETGTDITDYTLRRASLYNELVYTPAVNQKNNAKKDVEYIPKLNEQNKLCISAMRQMRGYNNNVVNAKGFNPFVVVEKRKVVKTRDIFDNLEQFITNETNGIWHTALGNGQFVGLKIDKSVDSSESFSNQTGETQLAQKLNGAAMEAYEQRMAQHGTKGLITGGLPKTGFTVIDATADTLNAMVGTVAGAIIGDQTVQIKTGAGFFSIPEVWKNSSMGKSHSISLTLRSRAGDPISIFQSIYIPLAILLAGSWPRTVGRNTYTSPFLLQAYCKGMFSIPLGIVESITISRGDSDFGWSHQNLPLVVKVSLSIRDLNPVIHLSLGRQRGLIDSTLLSGFSEMFARNTPLQEYLTTLSGVGLRERIYGWPRFKRRMTAYWEIFQANSNLWNSSHRRFFLGSGILPNIIASFTSSSDIRTEKSM